MDLKTSVQERFGAAAARYAASGVHSAGPDLERMLAVSPRAAARVLDVGCGAGHCALAFAAAGFEVEGLDLTPGMLAQARRLAAERSLRSVRFRRGDAEALPYADASFDLVTSRLSAHHYARPQAALAEMARVLRPGGVLLLSDSVSPEEPALDTFLNAIELLRDPSHVRDHSLSQWQRMLAAAGLESEVLGCWPTFLAFGDWVERMGTAPAAAAQILALFDAAPVEVREAFRLDARGTRSFTIPIALLRGRRAGA